MTRRHASDRAALGLAIGVHGLVLLLLFGSMRDRPPPMPAPTAALTMFDVAVPPPPPVARPKPVPSPIPPSDPRPGAATAEALRPPMAMDHMPRAPAPAVAPISSPFADDQGVTQLTGAGTGDGMGRGDGHAAGIGDDGGRGGGRAAPRYAGAKWITSPDPAELRAYWPAAAVKSGIGGHAELACIVRRPGKPTRCWVLSESPRNIGFGRAALAMSHLFRINPVRRDGDPVDTPVIVPVAYAPATPPKP